MRIQNNIMAANTHRQYSINNSNAAKAAEKLSSGFRINRAGDDAAGLAISEKMRAQVRGLNMASKNSQDAISLVQTAEGALQEVHSMLQRMNELAVQANTGTNESFDRAAISAEFEQLKSEIDDISSQTTFNNMKILDGSLAGSGSVAGGVMGDATAVVGGAAALGDGAAQGFVSKATLAFGTANTDILLKSAGDNAEGVSVQMKLGLSDGTSTTLNFIFGAGADVTAAGLATALKTQLENPTADFLQANQDFAALKEKFTINVNNAGAKTMAPDVTFTSTQPGSGLKVSSVDFNAVKLGADGVITGTAATITNATAGTIFKGGADPAAISTSDTKTDTAAYKKISFADVNAALEGKTATIGGKTYQFLKADQLGNVEEGNVAVVLGANKEETMRNLVAQLKSDGVKSASVFNTGRDTEIKIGNLDELKTANAQAVSASTKSNGITLGNDRDVDGQYTFTTSTTGAAGAGPASITVQYTDAQNRLQTRTITDIAVDTADTADGRTANRNAIVAAINNDVVLKDIFTASTEAGAGKESVTLTAKNNKNGAKLVGVTGDKANFVTVAANDPSTIANPVKALGAGQTISFDNSKIASGDMLEVNGKKYQFLAANQLDTLEAGATAIILGATNGDTANNFKVALASNGIVAKDAGAGKVIIENDVSTSVKTTGGIMIQVGASQGETLNIAIAKMDSVGLGVAKLSIATQGNEEGQAGSAITAVKAAINLVSEQRASLGAMQNRLEHKIANLDTSAENLQAAESRIRDVDMAKEMTNFTKQNILSQAATAMLAQANSAPQNVLQLLR